MDACLGDSLAMGRQRNGHEVGIEMLPFAGLVYPLGRTRPQLFLQAGWRALTGWQRHDLLLPISSSFLVPSILPFPSVLLFS